MGVRSFFLYCLQSSLPFFFKPRVREEKLLTEVQLAAIYDKEDLFKELISAGALVILVPVNDPEDITHNKKICQMVQNLASKGNVFCSKIKYFLDMELAVQVESSPEEVFKTFYSDMLQEHPQTHLTMTETLFIETGPNADKYHLGSIKWLKDTENVNTYIAGVASRFPNIPETFITRAVHSLRAVLCTMKDVPNDQALAIIDKLLDQLSKKERHEKTWKAVLKTLYVIIQKTKRMNGWDLKFVEKLCKTIVHFVQDQHPFKFRVYTYGIFANLLSVEHAASIITSVGVTSVPEDILTYADMKMNDKLKELLKHFSECEDCTAESKKKMEKAENPNNEIFPDDQLSVSVSLPDSNVKSFNLKPTDLVIKYKCKQNNKRWRDKLMKLHSTDESEVTRIGSMVYINKPEFCIVKKSDGTEVYLGQKNDGTELAIKKVPQSNSNQVRNEEEILRLPELFDAPIVRYNDYEEDEKFIYLALHLCEYTLEEHIKLKDGDQEKLVSQMLDGLKALHCHNPPILHGHLKPQNILIDVNGKARLAGFGKSRRLPTGKTTLPTGSVETKEADIEMAGMLIHYIYTGGHQPFGDVPCDNIDVDDVLAKDLIEMMIDAEPQKRPKVEECLNHPLFWSTERRLNYLKEVGNRKEVEDCRNADAKLISSMNGCVREGSGEGFTEWNKKFPPELVGKLRGSRYPDDMLGLLRFTRNVYQHYPEEAAKLDLVSMFPRLFECAYMLAKSQGWNSEPLLKQMLITSDESTASDAETATSSDDPLKMSVQDTHHPSHYR